MLSSSGYTSIQLDVLKELANIGGGNAASGISKMIGEPVNMTVPVIEILRYEEVYEQIMAEDAMVNGVLLRVVGDADGVFLFVASDEVAHKLLTMMMPSGMNLSSELTDSGLKELVNIVVSSYLNAIAMMINKNLIATVPMLIKDMFGAIFSSVYIESGQYDDNVMIIKNEFLYQGDRLESSLYFVPVPGLIEGLFKILGVGEGE